MKKNYFLPSSLAIALFGLSNFASAETTIELQRFFGDCAAQYAEITDPAQAVGECGIITTLVNKFAKENPDIKVHVTTVEWPGYDQLNAQLASDSAPDIVSMHYSAIADYQDRGLILPIEDVLKTVGLDESVFTEAALSGAKQNGNLFALPFDNWSMLYHVNLNLMKEAGLVKEDGTPIFPTSVEEFYQQAEQFKQKTGKPYLIQTETVPAMPARMVYTYLQQQNSNFFDDPTHIVLNTPEGKAVADFMKQTVDKGYTTTGFDYGANVTAFSRGQGGIAVNGTWLIGDYVAEAEKPDSPLANGYTVYPVPQLFAGRNSTYVDGHGWALPRKDRSDEQLAAIGKFFKFLVDNDYEWSRTGHLPAVKAVYDTAEFKALPHRSNIAVIAEIGHSLPVGVKRQFSIQDIVGEEFAAISTGAKSAEEALTSAETRVNELLEE